MRAVEDALGITVPDNARIIRNLISGIQYVQDHVIHFYHLHALDWVDITSALKADPGETSKLAQSISSWPKSSTVYFKTVQDRLKQFVESGQLGLFANGYWGHPAYKLPPAANLMAVAHYLEALDWQREVIKIHAILGSKNPHPQTYLVGGMAIPLDPNSAVGAQRRQAGAPAPAPRDRQGVRRPGLPPRRPGHRPVLQGLGRDSAPGSATT